MMWEEVEDIERLRKINRALMARVESTMDQQGNAFSLFQTAINLEGQVRRRTDELSNALRRVERANTELAAAKELAELANLAKTRFLAAASHDVLQPLNAALLSLSVLTDLQQTEMGRTLALQIERSLDSMNDLLKTLIDISKLDAGVVDPKIEPIAICDMFDRLSSDFLPIAEERGLQLRFRCKRQAVLSDRTMLRRILQNLVSNALKYTTDGGVVVRARDFHGDRISIDIVDTGPGIPAEQHESIFDEFHRGALPRGHDRDSGSGLGLGLSIVRRTVNTLGHKLEMRSMVGRGTRFRILLPAALNPANLTYEEARPARPLISSISGLRVLFIENDAAGLEAGEKLLSSWGCDVRVSSSTVDAIARLDEGDWLPDVIVADLHLDNGDLGTIAVKRARAHLGSEVPAIIFTADPSDKVEQEVRAMNLDLMYKPLRPARLRALLSHMYQREG